MFPVAWENETETFLYKITCFIPIEPSDLEERLRDLQFKPTKKGYKWQVEGSTFLIEPFENQPRDRYKAYRIYFNCSWDMGAYLFDLSIGHLGSIVTGIECMIKNTSISNDDWIHHFREDPSYEMVDSRGLFRKNSCGIIVVNHSVILQVRSKKNQRLKVIDVLKKIDSIREEVLSFIESDLFLFHQKKSKRERAE